MSSYGRQTRRSLDDGGRDRRSKCPVSASDARALANRCAYSAAALANRSGAHAASPPEAQSRLEAACSALHVIAAWIEAQEGQCRSEAAHGAAPRDAETLSYPLTPFGTERDLG